MHGMLRAFCSAKPGNTEPGFPFWRRGARNMGKRSQEIPGPKKQALLSSGFRCMPFHSLPPGSDVRLVGSVRPKTGN